MNVLLILHIYLSCHDDTVTLTNHICLIQDDGNIRTYLTHIQKTYNMNNKDSDVERNTDINVAMEINLEKVRLNQYDTSLSS